MNRRGLSDEFSSTEGNRLIVRPARLDDAMDILRWRNDPVVCAMSRNNEPVSLEAHLNWYARAVVDPKRVCLLGVFDGESIGVVRFDQQDASLWEVSITIAAEARGQGLGQSLLRIALRQFYETNPLTSVLAVARLNNGSSLRLFRALGFNRVSDDGMFESLVFSSGSNTLCI